MSPGAAGCDSDRMNAMRRGGAVLGALVTALAVAGCGAAEQGGTGPGAGSERPATGAVNSAAGAAAGQAEVQVNRSYWYAGFKVTLGTARLLASSPVVTIDATFQNLSSTRDAAPTGELELTSGADTYDKLSKEHAKLPEIPAQRSRTGVIAIEVDERFDLSKAVLTVGAPRTRQAVVPLGRADGLISLEPRRVTISGRAYPNDRKDVFITVTGGEVRADDPTGLEQAPAGQEFVLISFSATNDGAAGMTYVFDRDLTLVKPDGTKAGDAGSCSRAQVHVQPHATVTPPGPACFAVPAPATGTYRFVWYNKDTTGVSFSIA
jgi:hypothetical protein